MCLRAKVVPLSFLFVHSLLGIALEAPKYVAIVVLSRVIL